MTDSSDHAQACVFISMLRAEIAATSIQVEDAERLSRTAWETGHNSTRLWHNERARSQRKILYELHRQLDALDRRFPGATGDPGDRQTPASASVS